MVRSLGVTLGQGYLLGRPADVEAWSHAQDSERANRAPRRDRRRHQGDACGQPGRSASSPSS
jgi:predicted signal transduction protein with EAL and GGDEF domain